VGGAVHNPKPHPSVRDRFVSATPFDNMAFKTGFGECSIVGEETIQNSNTGVVGMHKSRKKNIVGVWEIRRDTREGVRIDQIVRVRNTVGRKRVEFDRADIVVRVDRESGRGEVRRVELSHTVREVFGRARGVIEKPSQVLMVRVFEPEDDCRARFGVRASGFGVQAP
jgi:hypothetical protein